MRGLLQENAAATADAYMAWWNLAGVDCAVGEAPVNWLRPVQAPHAPQAPAPSIPAPEVLPMPGSLEGFQTWLREDASQPERRWAGAPILPEGPAKAPLMIITDMPDPADTTAGTLLTDSAGRLLDAMLRAMGLTRADMYVASLFCARPPGGMVEAADLNLAATRMRTHVMLADPKRLLLLGDRTARALLPSDAFQPGDDLRNFNHDGGTLPALATFHPRLLLGQPTAKAECWRMLQCLIEDMPK